MIPHDSWSLEILHGIHVHIDPRLVPKALRSLVVRTSGGSNWKFESQNGPLEVFHQAKKNMDETHGENTHGETDGETAGETDGKVPNSMVEKMSFPYEIRIEWS